MIRNGNELKWGHAFGQQCIISRLLEASQTFAAKSGRGVMINASGYLALADSGDDNFDGFALTGAITTGSTQGIERMSVDVGLDSKYWMPADAAVDITMINTSCDIIVSDGVQYADVGEANENWLIIYDVDVANQAVLVGKNPAVDRVAVTA